MGAPSACYSVAATRLTLTHFLPTGVRFRHTPVSKRTPSYFNFADSTAIAPTENRHRECIKRFWNFLWNGIAG